MSAIGVIGSVCSGHGGFPSRPAVSGDSFLKVSGIAVLVDGSAFPVHSDGNSAHAGSAIGSRGWFKINGKNVVCVGDPVDCGSVLASGNSFIQVS